MPSQEAMAVSVPEAALILGANVQTVRNLIANGKLQAYRVGRVFRIPLESLEAFRTPPKFGPAEAGRICREVAARMENYARTFDIVIADGRADEPCVRRLADTVARTMTAFIGPDPI